MKSLKRKIKFWLQRRIRGWSDDECWKLSQEFVKWLNTRLKTYKRKLNRYVGKPYFIYEYKDKVYTQSEIIDMLIDKTDWLIKTDDMDNINVEIRYREVNEEVLVLFRLIYWELWW